MFTDLVVSENLYWQNELFFSFYIRVLVFNHLFWKPVYNIIWKYEIELMLVWNVKHDQAVIRSIVQII